MSLRQPDNSADQSNLTTASGASPVAQPGGCHPSAPTQADGRKIVLTLSLEEATHLLDCFSGDENVGFQPDARCVKCAAIRDKLGDAWKR